ncbi:hypothetical protein [Frigoriflavimonas asaccharolytica]|uniref:Transposase n=1 Tax=Frigoriflavimonas asaccharolytica TaxID=2735899 RepID=A0A8J8GBH0_9FLAO|nr:hypothetical protein [Frigoriflavimonas asaccharolytica]NRS94175.1 transposase [Frigoriflavimonas asaccharolytica]
MMQHVTRIARNQMVFTYLEDPISQDNHVRFVDAFVEYIDLKALGFDCKIKELEVALQSEVLFCYKKDLF